MSTYVAFALTGPAILHGVLARGAQKALEGTPTDHKKYIALRYGIANTITSLLIAPLAVLASVIALIAAPVFAIMALANRNSPECEIHMLSAALCLAAPLYNLTAVFGGLFTSIAQPTWNVNHKVFHTNLFGGEYRRDFFEVIAPLNDEPYRFFSIA